MTIWEKYDLENRIRHILARVKTHRINDHHFGRPFLTPYQLAIEFAETYPTDYREITRQGLPLNGHENGKRNSFTQYIARELSCRIKTKAISDIEGCFVSRRFFPEMVFTHNGQAVRSVLNSDEMETSLFRLT